MVIPVTLPNEQKLIELITSEEEFCNVCFGQMGIPKSLTVNDPRRFRDGAYYTEGAGQTCSSCGKEPKKFSKK